MAAEQGGARPVTIADIARDLGITKMAVSKALRGHQDISELTRLRVAERARQLAYLPNSTSRSLRFHRSHLIGIVVPTFVYSFFGEMLEGANPVLEQAGYQSILTVSGEQPEREARQIEALLSRQVEGFIIASCQRQDALGIFERLRRRDVPFVMAGRRIEGLDSCFVGVDNVAVGKLVTGHLLACGRRRIAHLSGPGNMTGIERARGYEAALRAAGLALTPEFVVGGGDTRDVVAPAMQALLKRPDRPDAVFAYNDLAAVEAYRVIVAAGLRVPEDIAIAGVGNNRYSDLLASPLTTVDQTSQLMGKRAARLLLKWLTDRRIPEPREVHLRVRLIVRESSAGARCS